MATNNFSRNQYIKILSNHSSKHLSLPIPNWNQSNTHSNPQGIPLRSFCLMISLWPKKRTHVIDAVTEKYQMTQWPIIVTRLYRSCFMISNRVQDDKHIGKTFYKNNIGNSKIPSTATVTGNIILKPTSCPWPRDRNRILDLPQLPF